MVTTPRLHLPMISNLHPKFLELGLLGGSLFWIMPVFSRHFHHHKLPSTGLLSAEASKNSLVCIIDINLKSKEEVVPTRPRTFQPHSMPSTIKLTTMAPLSFGILLHRTQLLIRLRMLVLFLSTLLLPKAMIVLDYMVCLTIYLAYFLSSETVFALLSLFYFFIFLF